MTSFLHPLYLGLLLLLPLAFMRRERASLLFSAARHLRDLPVTWRARALVVPKLLSLTGLVLAVIALARPVERVPQPVVREGIGILLCLDTSSSMRANDLDPNRTRLAVAQQAATRFIGQRADDRIGLLTFARYPDLRCPPTADHRALAQLIGEIEPTPSESEEDATGIGNAVARGAQVLGRTSGSSRVLVLLTDGEENVAQPGAPGEIAPLHAAQYCAALGVRVYAIAAGQGRPDTQGNWQPLDTTRVEQMAKQTGGRFFAVRDAEALAQVYAEIDALEREEFQEPRFVTEERFLPFLAMAIALLVGARLLAMTVLGTMP
ncbi:MAG: VWA domain-containing protein [Planctomycetota bacterium]